MTSIHAIMVGHGSSASKEGMGTRGLPLTMMMMVLFFVDGRYCEKVWLMLEEKRIPYVVSKVNMRCYGR